MGCSVGEGVVCVSEQGNFFSCPCSPLSAFRLLPELLRIGARPVLVHKQNDGFGYDYSLQIATVMRVLWFAFYSYD